MLALLITAKGGYGPTITAFYSTDLLTWKNGTAFEIKNSTQAGFGGMCNNAVTRLDTPKGDPPGYVMAIESNMGKEYLQGPSISPPCLPCLRLANNCTAARTAVLTPILLAATFAYLNSSDLSQGWTQFDPKIYHYTDREYSACPTIRHFGGWFYVASLFSPCCGNAPRYQQMLVRSRDLRTWSGPALPDVPAGPMNTSRPGWTRTGNGTKYNPILCPLFDE